MVLKPKNETFFGTVGFALFNAKTKKGTVRKTVDTKFGQKVSLKNARYGNGTVYGKIRESTILNNIFLEIKKNRFIDNSDFKGQN